VDITVKEEAITQLSAHYWPMNTWWPKYKITQFSKLYRPEY